MHGVADAGALHDAGVEALAHGDLGAAVLFLRAAERLEPRAPDVGRNLSIAEARVALARGEPDAATGGASWRLPVSAEEGWLLCGMLLVLGALGMARRFRQAGSLLSGADGRGGERPSGRARRLSILAGRVLDAAGVLGVVAALVLAAGAVYDRFVPEAVVLDSSVRLTAPSGQSLPGEPALVAGERVRLGPEREGLVEVRLGATSVGWARRSAFWRVRDAAGYTPAFSPANRLPRGGADE